MAGKPRAEARSRPVTVRLSPNEECLAVLAAQANFQRLSEFVRDALVSAASECLEEIEDAPRRSRITP